jgi:hypothetical protein
MQVNKILDRYVMLTIDGKDVCRILVVYAVQAEVDARARGEGRPYGELITTRGVEDEE